jgi:hypothetical protein
MEGGIERAAWIPTPALADGTEVKAVWSHMVSIDVAKLVTVHFFDE